MKHPFKEGDVVYHPVSGRATVVMVDKGRDSLACICIRWGKDSGWVVPGLLSFRDWPKAEHDRPLIKEGWWIVEVRVNKDIVCREVRGGNLYIGSGAMSCMGVSDYRFIRHLGETIDE